VIGDFRAGFWGYWAVVRNGIYFLERQELEGQGIKYHLAFHDFAGRRNRQVLSFERRPFNSAWPSRPTAARVCIPKWTTVTPTYAGGQFPLTAGSSRGSMFHILEQRIQDRLRSTSGNATARISPSPSSSPKQSGFGEIALPAAFQLAKQLRQPPRQIAAEMVGEMGSIPGVAALEVAGNGYINVRFDVRSMRAASSRPTLQPKPARRRRSLSSTPTSIPTRPRTSAICATRRWATLLSACCGPSESASRCRTISTTPACR